jgi:hypothetical protein
MAVALFGCDGDTPKAGNATGAGTAAALTGPFDLNGQPVDPFAGAGTGASDGAKLIVFVFVRTDCPIANRLAPQIQRIDDEFSPRGVKLWLAYPDHDETPTMIREHLRAYGYRCDALRDPAHTLVMRCGAHVTPEAVVFRLHPGQPGGPEVIYRGRINDRFVDFGKTRASATQEDLRDALAAAVDGRAVAIAATHPIGCPIPSPR